MTAKNGLMKYGYMNEWMDGGHHTDKLIDINIPDILQQTLEQVMCLKETKKGQW